MPANTVTAAEIAQALGVARRTIERRAAADLWQYAEATGRGGTRRLYSVEQLPAAIRAKLKWAGTPEASPEARAAASAGRQAGTADAAATALRGRLEDRAAQGRREAALSRASTLGPKAQARLDAKLTILRVLEAFLQEADALPVGEAMLLFCKRYNAGEIAVSPAVRVFASEVSVRSLWRWRGGVREQGITSLAGAYGNRAGGGCIDSQPELREYLKSILYHHPHIQAAKVLDLLVARFAGSARLPGSTALKDWMRAWRRDNAQAVMLLANPDGWRNKYMAAFGSRSEDVLRVNQRWELDSTPADVMCTDGRYHLVAGIDVYSRRARIFVAKTSRATAVAAVLRKMLLDFGVPEQVKTDNGSDYTSAHVVRVLTGLGIEHTLCAPFSPDQKPHIERFFGTFTRGLAELLPGFIGHSVADRKAIEGQRSFAQRLGRQDEVIEVRLTGSDLQDFCDEWIENVYSHDPHAGLGQRTPFEVAAASTDELRTIPDERALDVLLAEAPDNGGWRTVQKKGVHVEGAWFIAPELHAWIGQRVQCRYDALDHDMGRLVIFGQVAGVGEMVYICTAVCPDRVGEDRREIAAKAKALQREHAGQVRQLKRALGRRYKPDQLVQEVRADRAAKAGKLVRLQRPGQEHVTPELRAAARAVADLDAPPRSSADVHDLAAVQAAQARIAAELAEPERGTPNPLAEARAALRGPQPTPVFETVQQRVQWLLSQARVRTLSTEEQESLAAFKAAQPASYRRLQAMVAEQAAADDHQTKEGR